MKVKLAAAGYQPILASDGASCLEIASRDAPDLILLDLMLPDISGLTVLQKLRSNPNLKSVPVVMFSANHTCEARIEAFQAGADDFLAKPIDDQTLLARIRSFMRARDMLEGFKTHQSDFMMFGMAEQPQPFRRPGVVAVLVERPESGMKLQRDLARLMDDRVLLMTPAEALNEGLNATSKPDVFLLGADLDAKATGLRLMSELRSRTHTRHAGICLFNTSNTISVADGFDLGANDQVPVTIATAELAVRLQRLILRKKEEDRLRASVQDGLRMAIIDPLTGLHNRRYGMAQLSTIAAESEVLGDSFAVMVADLDRFKSVNDRFGHAAGDAVLVEVANRLAVNLRAGDLVARIGGEEFLIVLPHTGLDQAQLIAKRLCQVVEQDPIQHSNMGALKITLSIGLAVNVARQASVGVNEIVDRADHALLVAKSAGRNQVTVARSAA